MKTFNLIVSSPNGDVFNDEVVCISLRGTEGDLAIMAGHIPFVTAVVPGDCNIELPDGTHKKAKTEGGIISVTEKSTTLLSGSFKWI